MRLSSTAAGILAVVLLGGLTASQRHLPGSVLLRGHVRPVTATDVPIAARFGAADTRFGLALLRRLTRADPTGNVVFSPAGVASGLGMAYLGARGATATSMAHTLCLPAGGESLLAGLRGRTAAMRALPQVTSSDLIWLDPTVRTNPDYLDRLATGYRAGVRQVPLLTDPGGAAETVNETVSRQTHGLIPWIVSPDTLDDAGWILTDTVYLKAGWADEFDPADTETGVFHAPNGRVRPEYLHRSGTLGYAQRDGWTAVALPYRGHRLRMLALLPDDDALVPSSDTLADLTAALGTRQVDLALPRVDLSYHTDLAAPLRAMGMAPAFEPGADFTGLSPAADRIRHVLHRATMAVTEKGTEAAAATAVEMRVTSARAPVPAVTVTFDRPYLMLVQDLHTGEPLFLARVSDPTRSS